MAVHEKSYKVCTNLLPSPWGSALAQRNILSGVVSSQELVKERFTLVNFVPWYLRWLVGGFPSTKDMFAARTDSSVVPSDWLLAAVLQKPRGLTQAQEELDRVVGNGRILRESDFSKLEYLGAIIKDTFRR
ncbi:hypothetical protein SELMODRAFT_409838 [Selaginella moellendorffii]|uniref:Cytochrome P450-dependent monooxygenase n=1 Tax=Selaginella moellendorffii TaxID=88036 RepID=D8RCL9_SELML|nr:hypothetical protein SELMODRAFT_409838 [Selaginella moellendorffii]